MKEKVLNFIQNNLLIILYLIIFPIIMLIADFTGGKEIKFMKYLMFDTYFLIGICIFYAVYYPIHKITKKPILSTILALIIGAAIIGILPFKPL